MFAAEENGSASRVVEIIDPLHTTNVTITGTTLSGPDASHVALRTALGALSFEGFGVMPTGVIYYGDEKRPGTGGVGGLGGSLYKFIPSTPWVVGNPPITSLAQSPLVDGRVFGFRPGRNGGSFSNTDAGPGNEFGRGWWVEIVEGQTINGVEIHKADLGTAAAALHLSAYYRPEDIDVDLAALEMDMVRVCGTNTGQDVPQGDNHWGEVYCLTDGTLEQAADTTTLTQSLSTFGVVGNVPYTTLTGSTPEYQPLVIGRFDFAMMDNIAYQPSTGNWILHEDGEGPSTRCAEARQRSLGLPRRWRRQGHPDGRLRKNWDDQRHDWRGLRRRRRRVDRRHLRCDRHALLCQHPARDRYRHDRHAGAELRARLHPRHHRMGENSLRGAIGTTEQRLILE